MSRYSHSLLDSALANLCQWAVTVVLVPFGTFSMQNMWLAVRLAVIRPQKKGEL